MSKDSSAFAGSSDPFGGFIQMCSNYIFADVFKHGND